MIGLYNFPARPPRTSFPAGNATAPGISFDTDTDTGIFLSAADCLSMTTNGVERTRIDGTGMFSIGLAGGLESLRVSAVAGSTGYWQLLGQGSGWSGPRMSVNGTGANISALYTAKGNGAHYFMSNSGASVQFIVQHVDSAVNVLGVGGAGLGGSPQINASGSDADINIRFLPKGAGRIQFGTRVAASDVPISGYIEIRDAAGTIRKLALID